MFFLSCNKWKSLWGFLVSSSHSFDMWDFFFLWFIFCYLIFVCAEVHWFHKFCSVDVLKVARNLLKEIFYIDFMSLTFYTSLNISMLLQGMVLNFSWMWKEGGEHRLVWDRLRVFCGVLHTLTLKKSLR